MLLPIRLYGVCNLAIAATLLGGANKSSSGGCVTARRLTCSTSQRFSAVGSPLTYGIERS